MSGYPYTAIEFTENRKCWCGKPSAIMTAVYRSYRPMRTEQLLPYDDPRCMRHVFVPDPVAEKLRKLNRYLAGQLLRCNVSDHRAKLVSDIRDRFLEMVSEAFPETKE